MNRQQIECYKDSAPSTNPIGMLAIIFFLAVFAVWKWNLV